MATRNNGSIIGKIAGTAIKATGLEMNAKKAYNSIPEKYKTFYFAKNDEMIPFKASLAKAVTPKSEREEIKNKNGIDATHSDDIPDKGIKIRNDLFVRAFGNTQKKDVELNDVKQLENQPQTKRKFIRETEEQKQAREAKIMPLAENNTVVDTNVNRKPIPVKARKEFKRETEEQKQARENIIKPAVNLDRNQEFNHAKILLDKALKENPDLDSFKISKAKKDQRGNVIAGEAELAHSFICQKNKNGEFELFRVLDFLGKGTEGKVKNIENEKGEIFVVKIAAASDKDSAPNRRSDPPHEWDRSAL